MKSFWIVKLMTVIFSCGFIAACSNSGSFSSKKSSATPPPDPLADNVGAQTNLKISSVRLETSTKTNPPIVRVLAYFNTKNEKNRPISDYCFGSNDNEKSIKPCDCKFTWTETNLTTEPHTKIPHQMLMPITLVQPGLVSCVAPPGITEEVEDGTPIHLTIVPNFSNSDKFAPIPTDFIKGQKQQTGDLVDAEGNSFVNILRYSCFDQRRRGIGIKNLLESFTDETQRDKTVRSSPYANRFCVTRADGTLTENCSDALKEIEYSSQANFYNLYIRNSEIGSLSPGNSSFICPMVKETLDSRTGTAKYWPLDTSFALSLNRNPNFSVGVVGNSIVGGEGDVTQTGGGCNQAASSSGTPSSNPGGLVQSCLGFAARPNPDGTCPGIVGKDGKSIPTFRLRRYLALYPPQFDTSGYPLKEPQATDTIYVVDRPVKSNSTKTSYTMLGAKPCPYAYFDRKGVASSHTNYLATNKESWAGKNVDGIQLPNSDYFFSNELNSCAAAIPILNAPKNNTYTLATTHLSSNPSLSNYGRLSYDPIHTSFQRVFIRPIKPWAPHYEEDVNFLACSPLANPIQDPPLHFAKDPLSGNVSYCAEVYPTQNDNIDKINAVRDALVIPYTSHFVKNTGNSECSYTALGNPRSYLLKPYEEHSSSLNAPESERDLASGSIPHYGQTCDRTVLNTGGPSWAHFPLLAQSDAVESALIADKSFQCSITFDENKGKAFSGKTPSQGCCGKNVEVWSQPDASHQAMNAHLEPQATTLCETPEY